MGVFIPHSKLHTLKEYKYQSDDRSITTKYFLKPFWTQFVKIFPLWMAPNMVTLSGLFFILLNLVTVLIYDPYLDNAEKPSWIYFSYALGLFLYQTFDACDGMQARRTGQSGPLGELFDHCIDALNTSLSCIVFGSTITCGWGWLLVVSQFATLMNFYMSTWEEYHTHVLFLSEFSGPVEGILILIGVYIFTGFKGAHVWKDPVIYLNLEKLNMGSEFPLTVTKLFSFIGAIGLLFNIYSARRNALAKLSEPSHQKEASKGLIPFFFFYTSVFVQVFLYKDVILPGAGLPLVLSIGLTMAFSVGRIIVAHLTKQDFPMCQPPMFIPIGEIILTELLTRVFDFDRFSVANNLQWTGFGLSLGIHALFVTEIIYEITGYLDIWALTIKHKKVD
ncbi:Phosphotransferase [Komagataella phaffii]|uniref:diacylglycerol cholinephosphotransferase n=1 Tax=Komagataella phaffii (strain GS115 / ATCC 20864) TaxID=644223 RepID=C4R224_KOMPG|nr:uncharacterized protein PAS_chr2-2_0357 [Komagataella phaffii GS115]AOA62239.1 GQ67_00968T0 [Komagataella phaffii]AOA67178.1 GQ68_00421T0 [Komagataella phaffii GS115]CAH2447906.1 sn-1,2-diacylglycerol ethanolamine-and cholinephosphotranferase [Komagataella phaffii CBS 7435]CAY69548.1 sn-1,2-diacylglycerol ethanolamine-and cholinephosphotranferase [Komagataella phaffii GS115]